MSQISIQSKKHYQKIKQKLLKWYGQNARLLPWRQTVNPYKILISEFMLQQTQVGRVIPYYKRFTKRFPDIQTLARARLQTILRYWQGLGYYGRARNLHTAAKIITNQYTGRIPKSIKELIELPGVGRYTAAAVASIAFDVNVPVVDGNVARVLCRLFYITDEPKRIPKKLFSLASDILSKRNAGLFNQSIMELGATLCTPKRPNCTMCPLIRLCRAKQNGQQADLPAKTHRKNKPCRRHAVAIIRKNQKILIVQQTKGRLLLGLWRFPSFELTKGSLTKKALSKHLRKEFNLKTSVGDRFDMVRHTYSHFTQKLYPFEIQLAGGSPKLDTQSHYKWVTMKTIKHYPLSGAHQKILTQIVAKNTVSQ